MQRIESDGDPGSVVATGNVGTGWTSVAPFQQPEQTASDVLLYNRSSGRVGVVAGGGVVTPSCADLRLTSPCFVPADSQFTGLRPPVATTAVGSSFTTVKSYPWAFRDRDPGFLFLKRSTGYVTTSVLSFRGSTPELAVQSSGSLGAGWVDAVVLRGLLLLEQHRSRVPDPRHRRDRDDRSGSGIPSAGPDLQGSRLDEHRDLSVRIEGLRARPRSVGTMERKGCASERSPTPDLIHTPVRLRSVRTRTFDVSRSARTGRPVFRRITERAEIPRKGDAMETYAATRSQRAEQSDQAPGPGALAVLQSCSGFERRVVKSLAIHLHVDRGQVVCEAGEFGDELFVILDGAVAVQTPGETMSRLGAGDAFGEMAPLARTPRRSTVVAIAPTALLVYRRREFAKLLDRAPGSDAPCSGRPASACAPAPIEAVGDRPLTARPGRRPAPPGTFSSECPKKDCWVGSRTRIGARCCAGTRRRKYARGEIVFHEGDLGDALPPHRQGPRRGAGHHPARRRLDLHGARSR